MKPPCWVRVQASCCIPKEQGLKGRPVGVYVGNNTVHWIGAPKWPTQNSHWNVNCLELAEDADDTV